MIVEDIRFLRDVVGMGFGGTTSQTAKTSGVILNVNDDDGNRLLISEILRRGGFNVQEAENGMRALERTTSSTDVVVLDVNLPDMDGFEVCRQIKAAPTTSSVLVLLLSAQSVDLADRVTGLEEGADGYLTLPLAPGELVAVVKSLLRLRRAEQAHAREACRAKLAADLVVTLNDSQPLHDDLQRCAAAFVEWLDIEVAGIWLAEPKNHLFRLAAATTAHDLMLDGIKNEIPFDDSCSSPTSFECDGRGDQIDAFNLRGTQPEWMIDQNLRAGVSHPLIVDESFVGLLEVYSRSLRASDLLHAIAGPAATLALGIQRKKTSEALKAAEEVSQRRQDRVRELEKELQELERLTSSSSTIVTARTYGNSPLRETHPTVFEELVGKFRTFLEQSLEQRSHRVDHQLSERLREFSDRVGFLRAGPRDIIDVYSMALKSKSSDTTEQKERALVEEGRLLVLELMGNVLSYYRATSLGAVRTVSREDSPKGASDE